VISRHLRDLDFGDFLSGFFGLKQADFQDPVLERCLDLIHLHLGREFDAATEAAGGSLATAIVFFLCLFLTFLLPLI
jgi:hypothetical protein